MLAMEHCRRSEKLIGILFRILIRIERQNYRSEHYFFADSIILRFYVSFHSNSAHLKSQNGSNVTLVLPHTVHFNELFSWPTNKSLITEFSTFEYLQMGKYKLAIGLRTLSVSDIAIGFLSLHVHWQNTEQFLILQIKSCEILPFPCPIRLHIIR